MTTLNTQYRILNRSGAVISTVSATAFWGVAGHQLGDPEIVYDPYGGRFITSAETDAQTTAAALLVAVSQTSDPTGNWNTYRYTTNPTTATVPDQPRLGFNKTWIILSVNVFDQTGINFQNAAIYIFDKLSLYGGTFHSPTVKSLANSAKISIIPAVTDDANQSTEYLLQNFASPTWRKYTITEPIGAEVLSSPVSITLPTSWTDNHTTAYDGPQLNGPSVDIHDTRMQSCVYRVRSDGSGAIWGAHNIFLIPPARASIQWAQISTSGTIYQSGRIDDSTGFYFYGYPSISVNVNNDALIGYSVFSQATLPTAGYMMRYAADAVGALRGAINLKPGQAVYSKFLSGLNRWGDYSATVLDPVNDRDFWTIQEYAALPIGGVSQWGTWWGRLSNFRRLAGGLQHGLSQFQIGYFAASGQDVQGQLGDGATTNRTSATTVAVQTTDMAAGDYNSLGVSVEGNVLAWGSNQYGQLGNGTTGGQTSQPTQVPNLANIVTQTGDGRHIVSSNFGVCAVVDNVGQVWTWGVNYNGQLGDGTTTPHYVPKLVKNSDGSTFTGAISIAAGADQMAALKSDGTVWAWGGGASGALGNGSTLDHYHPVQVLTGAGQGLISVAQVVSGGSDFSLALKTDGTVWGWGANGSGQLGLGDTINRLYAKNITSGMDKIAAGAYHSLAHSSSLGHVYGWGYNGYGQLGNPAAAVNQLTPIQMVETNGNVGITDLAAGGYFSMMAKALTDGVYTVGDNQSGQLAIGNTVQQNIPVASNY